MTSDSRSLGAVRVALNAGLTAMRANPMRASLATLGVVIGSAALVSILSVSDGVEKYARDRMSSHAFDRVILRPITEDTVDGQLVARERPARIDARFLDDLSGALVAGERAVLSVAGVTLAELGSPSRSRAIAVRGIAFTTPDSSDAAPRLVSGRWLTADESRSGAPVVVVNEPLARLAGDSLLLRGRWLRVVGVAAADTGVGRQRRDALALTAPQAIAEPMLIAGRGIRVGMIGITTPRAEETRAMRDRVTAWLDRRDPEWKHQYRLEARAESMLAEMQRFLLVFRLFMGAITGITLVVGGIGIMNVLLASVAERTREIGVRKAVGARQRDILLQFLAESVTITGLGTVIGTTLGLGAAYLVTAVMRAQTEAIIYAAITPQTLGIAALTAIIVGTLFGSYPAARAARLAPIQAIHIE